MLSASEAAAYMQSSEESVKMLKKCHFKIKHIKEVWNEKGVSFEDVLELTHTL